MTSARPELDDQARCDLCELSLERTRDGQHHSADLRNDMPNFYNHNQPNPAQETAPTGYLQHNYGFSPESPTPPPNTVEYTRPPPWNPAVTPIPCPPEPVSVSVQPTPVFVAQAPPPRIIVQEVNSEDKSCFNGTNFLYLLFLVIVIAIPIYYVNRIRS